jgi:two-component system, LuxR family, response regulator FixJ
MATVYVVDDDATVRQSLEWLMGSVGLPVRSFATAEEFLTAWSREAPGCLVLDIRMPGMGGLNLLSRLADEETRIPVIIVTGYADVPTAVRAMKTGAVDFIEKPFNDQELLDRVRRAVQQGTQNGREQTRRSDVQQRLATLTSRERQVLKKILAGLTSRQIAEELGLSARTVEVHRGNVMKKMRAEGVQKLVRLTFDLKIEG